MQLSVCINNELFHIGKELAFIQLTIDNHLYGVHDTFCCDPCGIYINVKWAITQKMVGWGKRDLHAVGHDTYTFTG